MSKLNVTVHHQKIVHFANQIVSKERAESIESFANENGFEMVISEKDFSGRHSRFELDRRSNGTPFIIIDEKEGREKRYLVGGMIGNKHADLFLEEFCDEQGND